MSATLSIAAAQLNFMLGDIQGNAERILTTIADVRSRMACDVVVFPELALTGYPPEDLLLRDELYTHIELALRQITNESHGIHVIVGHPQRENGQVFNCASILNEGKIKARYYKQSLPNYGVFDEKRYFTPGNKPCVIKINDIHLGITICEDLWEKGPIQLAMSKGAQAILCLNASPFHNDKSVERQAVIVERQHGEAPVPFIYINAVGGQDELVFDGGSMAIDRNGTLCHRLPFFTEAVEKIDLTLRSDNCVGLSTGEIATFTSNIDAIYQALITGTRDYIEKNNFPGVLIGLSGGIDSALTLSIATAALGPKRVKAVLMPSRFTAQMSIEDATAQAVALGVEYTELTIEPAFEALSETLKKEFAKSANGLTEENIQARIRAVLLMALSNQSGKLVLTTSNKSELAVGYATLYGDMAGGFNVLKDIPKTQVYQLARHCNQLNKSIPERVFDRAPTAELRAGQTDQDTLPEYEVLDRIISLYVEHNKSAEEIVALGLEQTVVDEVIEKIIRSEYKRRQAVPGVRVSHRAFGRDWRYPITSAFGKK